MPPYQTNLLKCIKPFVEAVLEEEIEDQQYFELVIQEGITAMCRQLLDSLEPETLVQSFLQLAHEHPRQVFAFMAGRMTSGAELRRQEAKIGWAGFIKSR